MKTPVAATQPLSSPTQIPEPPLARFLFADTRLAWFWRIVRVYAGWHWLEAGSGKWTSTEWTGSPPASG